MGRRCKIKQHASADIPSVRPGSLILTEEENTRLAKTLLWNYYWAIGRISDIKDYARNLYGTELVLSFTEFKDDLEKTVYQMANSGNTEFYYEYDSLSVVKTFTNDVQLLKNSLLYDNRAVCYFKIDWKGGLAHDNLIFIYRNSSNKVVFERFEPAYGPQHPLTKMTKDNTIHTLLKTFLSSPLLLNEPVDYVEPGINMNDDTYEYGPQIHEETIPRYIGEGKGYCAMWCSKIRDIYESLYSSLGNKIERIFDKVITALYEDVGYRYSEASGEYKDFAIRLRKYIQEYSVYKLDMNLEWKEQICEGVREPTIGKEYLMRSFINLYFSDPQKVLNVVLGSKRDIKDKITLKYFSDFDSASDRIELTRNDFLRENELLLYNEFKVAISGKPNVKYIIKSNIQFEDGLYCWFMMIGEKPVGREKVKTLWLLEIPLSYYNSVIRNQQTHSILYLEDSSNTDRIGIGHTNYLRTTNNNNQLTFDRYDPDYNPDPNVSQMVKVDGNGLWTRMLGNGMISLFNNLAGGNVYTTDLSNTRGIVVKWFGTSDDFPGFQAIETSLQREQIEFIGYCQIWSLKMLDIVIDNNITAEEAIVYIYNEAVPQGTNIQDVPIFLRNYIRNQASRYVKVIAKGTICSPDVIQPTQMDMSNPSRKRSKLRKMMKGRRKHIKKRNNKSSR